MPDTTTYHLAFDAVKDFRPGPYGHEALAALALGIVIFVVFLVTGSHKKHRVPLWLFAAGVIPAAFFGLGLGLSYFQVRQIQKALSSGRFTTLQGVVTQFQQGDGHRSESFVVAGHRYEYSSSQRSAAFNRDAAVGGPIRDSLRVRITDVDGDIVRLEIAQ